MALSLAFSDPQTAGTMDSRSLAAAPLAGGETVECCKHECSTLDILKDVQNLVEMSYIVNVSMTHCF